MLSERIVDALARQPIFHGLSPEQLSTIARNSEYLLYNPGAMMIEENAVGDGAILIISGEAARVSGPELRSRSEPVPVGALLGENAMLVETSYGSTVVARTPVRALFIARDMLHAQICEDPSVGDCMVQNMAGRLTQIADDLRKVDAILAGERAESSTPRLLPGPSDSGSHPAPPN
jgi:signal-transduction protein with cAMP-binding, CBS, and nucleotidyltransferase domain